MRVPWNQTVFYETHVRGFTMKHPGRARARSAAPSPAWRCDEVIGPIRELGVTSVELLPVQMFLNQPFLTEKGLTNYWGYDTIGFFALDQRYMDGPNIDEFKNMVDRFHAHGLEVILDVVYNHTPEGNELGPTISFKGIDNASYYRLMPRRGRPGPRYYINDTGTGNTVNLSHPRVLQMVTDSLRYWVTEMHVDGFRFDLATILAREPHGFDEGGGFLKSCRQDPVLSSVKLIAEPWDIGPGGYQVGGFPPGWAEWNDQFRDTVRAFWKGDEAMAPALAQCLTASSDRFNKRGRRPWASVNFISAHDGFTLADTGQLQREAQRGQRRRQPRRPRRQPQLELRRRRPDRRRRTCSRCARASSATCSPRCCCRRARRCCWPATSSAAPSRATTTPTARTTTSRWVDWDSAGSEAGQALTQLRRSTCTHLRQTTAGAAPQPLPHRPVQRSRRRSRTATWLAPDGDEMDEAHWNDPQTRWFALLLDGTRPRPRCRSRRTTPACCWSSTPGKRPCRSRCRRRATGEWQLRVDTANDQAGQGDGEAVSEYLATGRSLILFTSAR